MKPALSSHFEKRQPSSIRLAQIAFMKRRDQVIAVNTAIGNVSLPMHPAMRKRMFSLSGKDSPFATGVVKYSPTVGETETNQAFLHLIEASGFSSQNLYSQITDGGSHAMELAILGVCGAAGSHTRPLLVIDPIYTNYTSFAERTGRDTASITRRLDEHGKFSLPSLAEIENAIKENRPAALLVIPYDNPTGQFFNQKAMNELARLCVKYNLWLISDEAYRELFYTQEKASSVWAISEKDVPGITARRISIESASKVWNACGLRIGALITDNKEFHEKAVAENTANLCANSIGQYIFGALSHESKESLQNWYQIQRAYYHKIARELTTGLKRELPELIVSSPDSSLYTVADMRNVCGEDFDANDFVMYCAERGSVEIKGIKKTLLTAPMDGFYCPKEGQPNPGQTQIRIAYVEPPEIMTEVPQLLAHLLQQFVS
jgi:aspartate aminotransferase